MVLNYVNCLEDLVAYSIFRFEKSPSIKKRNSFLRYGTTVICGLIPVILASMADTIFLMALSPILAIFAYIYFSKTLRSKLSNTIKRQLEESGAERFLNIPRSLKLEDDGILSSSDAGIAKYPYSSVTEISTSDEHLFVVVKGGTGYAVPLNQIAFQLDDFILDINRRVATANSSLHIDATRQ